MAFCVFMSGGSMDKIFAYCERGMDPSFWAEPLNAVSNAAFLIAAVAALMLWQRQRHDFAGVAARSGVELALVLLVAVIGIGSFLFHTLATRWAMLADVIPISVFMVAYLGYALRRFVGLGWIATGIALVAFFASIQAMESIDCGEGRCLNGSIGYVPAFGALVLIGAWLGVQGHPAARLLLGGAAVFAVSLILRTLDRAICPQTASLFGSDAIGTHFGWHVLNAVLLYMLMSAAIRYGIGGHRSHVDVSARVFR